VLVLNFIWQKKRRRAGQGTSEPIQVKKRRPAGLGTREPSQVEKRHPAGMGSNEPIQVNKIIISRCRMILDLQNW